MDRAGESAFTEYHEFIPEFDRFLESLRRPLPVHLRLNRLKCEPRSVVESLSRKGVGLTPSWSGDDSLYFATGLTSPGKLLEYFLGYLHPQALSSCLAAVLLSPPPGCSVLDLCAAPGGKTAQLAQSMENSGLIVANELYANRRVPLGHTLSRLGVQNAVITGYQAQEFPLRQRFDRVLADVPCSAEGRFRSPDPSDRHPAAAEKERLLDMQRRILLRGFDLLNPGGILLYATCTYDPRENEAVVAHLLRERPARLLSMPAGLPHEPGLREWKEENYDSELAKTARLYPHRVDSVGFFMARLDRPG